MTIESTSSKQQSDWMSIVARIHSGELVLNPDEIRAQWKECFAGWSVEKHGPVPIWFPQVGDLNNANVSRWMKDQGHKTYPEFHQWSAESREDFWQQRLDCWMSNFVVNLLRSWIYLKVLPSRLGCMARP